MLLLLILPKPLKFYYFLLNSQTKQKNNCSFERVEFLPPQERGHEKAIESQQTQEVHLQEDHSQSHPTQQVVGADLLLDACCPEERGEVQADSKRLLQELFQGNRGEAEKIQGRRQPDLRVLHRGHSGQDEGQDLRARRVPLPPW